MLELHDCIYCGKPLVVNTTSGKVFNISCGHFEQEVMFYIVQGVSVTAAGTPVQVVDYAAMWEGDDEEED